MAVTTTTTKKQQQKYVVTSWYMEHHDPSANSHKFYQVFLFETGLVVLRWGRVDTQGQSSVTQYPSFDEGHDVALRQVYAKKSKGYISQYDGVRFMVEHDQLDFLRRTQNTVQLTKVLNSAMEESQFAGARDAVLQHYVAFSEQAQRLLHRAPTADLEEVMEDYDALEAVWQDICDKHSEVSVAMSLAKQTLTQKLMGGQ